MSDVKHASAEARSQYLSFFIAGDEYAVNILRVKEIIEYDAPTRMPAMPACVRGAINLRGRVVPIIDLAAKFGLPGSTVTRRSCIVVVEVLVDGEPTVMGMIADAVSQVLDLQPGQIENAPSFGTRVRAEYLDGLGTSGQQFVLILNIDRALAVGALPDGTTAAAA